MRCTICTPTGSSLVVVTPGAERSELMVVLNFFEELNAKVGNE